MLSGFLISSTRNGISPNVIHAVIDRDDKPTVDFLRQIIERFRTTRTCNLFSLDQVNCEFSFATTCAILDFCTLSEGRTVRTPGNGVHFHSQQRRQPQFLAIVTSSILPQLIRSIRTFATPLPPKAKAFFMTAHQCSMVAS